VTTVNGKLIFNPEGAPPGNFLTPIPQCQRGYLIGWVINASDFPIKFDGLIGDAVLRESATAVSAYNAIPIQANPALPPGSILSDIGDPLDFGMVRQAVTGTIFGDVTYDRPLGAASPRATNLTLLTLDVRSNRPNNPTFVDINFYNAQEALLSTSTEFICWGERQLSTDIDPNLTGALMGSRKGVFVAGPAEKVNLFGIDDTSGPATLLGLVETLEGPTLTERQYIYGVFNDSVPVPTAFFP
jgi:hypothetical protein